MLSPPIAYRNLCNRASLFESEQQNKSSSVKLIQIGCFQLPVPFP